MHTKRHIHKLGFFITAAILSGHTIIASTLTPNSVPATTIEVSEIDTNVNLDYSKYITEDQFLLPRNLYVLKGTAFQTERLNLYYRNALMTLSNNANISSFGPYGQSLVGRWQYQTTWDPNTTPNEPFDLKFIATTDNGIIDHTTKVEVVDQTNATPVRLLPIGDSLTRAGVYVSQVVNSLPNVTSLGTRYYPNDYLPAREGRGGWTLEKYCTFINSKELDSPFVFPVNVSGTHYKGNARDWRAICYDDPNNPAYNGFQKMARGWKDEGEFLYDTNGYYKYPSIGDVMVDPLLPIGSQWIEWTGSFWQPMANQPTEFEFNFTKYMERFKEAFASGTPTHISLLLGANEFGFNKELDRIDLFMARLNMVIDSIHSYDPTIKIILCTPTLAPTAFRVTSLKKSFYEEYDLRIKYVASKMLEAFDTDEALARKIYIAPMTLTLDTTNGYTYVEKTEIINGFPTPVIDVANSIHPNNEFGQIQMGNTLAAVIQKFR